MNNWGSPCHVLYPPPSSVMSTQGNKLKAAVYSTAQHKGHASVTPRMQQAETVTLTLTPLTQAARDAAALRSRLEVSGTQAKEKPQLMQQQTPVTTTAQEHRQNTRDPKAVSFQVHTTTCQSRPPAQHGGRDGFGRVWPNSSAFCCLHSLSFLGIITY